MTRHWTLSTTLAATSLVGLSSSASGAGPYPAPPVVCNCEHFSSPQDGICQSFPDQEQVALPTFIDLGWGPVRLGSQIGNRYTYV